MTWHHVLLFAVLLVPGTAAAQLAGVAAPAWPPARAAIAAASQAGGAPDAPGLPPSESTGPGVTSAAVPGTAGAYAAEAAGAAAGSALGFWLGYLNRGGCEAEDLQCVLRKAGSAIALGTAGAVAGDLLAGRSADTDPSLLGAILGGVLGAAAGVGAWHLASEELGLFHSAAPAIITYSLTQGLVTAAGSRLARALH